MTLPEATNDTLSLIKAAQAGGARTWRYSKAGVVTTDLMLIEDAPRALIGQLDRARSAPLMEAMDACNARFGLGAVVPARRAYREARLVDEVRDAQPALHHAGERAADRARLITASPSRLLRPG